MPIYQYDCPNCGHSEEVIRKVDNRDDPFICPECAYPAARVEFTRTTFTMDTPNIILPD